MLKFATSLRCFPALWLSPESRVPVPKFILIVDNSEVIRLTICRFLDSQPGLQVCGTAVDGVEALEKVLHLHPDLIVLDFAMPGLNGLQTALRLRAQLCRIPIILFTWHADAIHEETAAAAGVSAVVCKTDPHALHLRITELLAP